ncbi:hypothetical protein F4808DRAFT_466603 [Astrocystis sublimbata]|nr:hypothetical protein F4808DRAFT_466603 [Astrocystis sublimbata]
MEDAPPPYEEVVSGSATPFQPPTRQPRLMPLDFNIYCGEGPFSSSDLYYMGPHQAERQFALTLRRNTFAQCPKPFLILHDGVTVHDPAIGTSTNAWTKGQAKFHDKFTIALTGSSLFPSVQESLEAVHGGSYWHPVTNMQYSVQVAPTAAGGRNERQRFEWQENTSREALGGDSRGWRLVSLADESKTLALCARNQGSLTKYFRFSFRGKGRAVNYFGPAWEVMAVLTALTIWQREIDLQD